MTRVALFPGSYDPFTLGHYDLVLRALKMFDRVVIAVGDNMEKNTYFTLDERLQYIRDCFIQHPRVEILSYKGLTAEYCRANGIGFIIRGVRNSIDFAYESTIAQANARLWPDLETIFIVTRPEYAFISSSVVREVLYHRGDVSAFLPSHVSLPKKDPKTSTMVP